METGLLNFHDEETFATSIYDQGDFSGVDGQNSLLDMMHSDLQYSSDYLNQSTVHWDSDQEQEHNGDLAVLPVAPSECSSLNSSREDYHKSLFEWQDSLLPYQPLDPDGVDLRLDGQAIPSELPDNIFEDSFESNSSVASSIHKPSLPDPLTIPARCSTPNPSPKESAVSSDASLNLDMSLSGLDVNVSDIDVSALGINVSTLDIKTDSGDIVETKPLVSLDDTGQPDCNVSSSSKIMETEELLQPAGVHKTNNELAAADDHEFTALFGAPEGPPPFQSNSEPNSLIPSLPVLDGVQLPVPKIENSEDVEQLHDIAMEFIKEEQEAQAWDDLPLLNAPLDCNVDLDSITTAEVPVLEAGNLESLLEQFEATLKPAPEFSQSMPASPAHFSIPPSPLSMPASPSCISASTHTPMPLVSETSPLPSPSPSPSPSKSKSEASTPKKASPSKGVSVLHQNILESLPAEIMDRIKASGRKKTISVIPAMPSKKAVRSGTRMQAAGATLSRNKLLKLVSRKGAGGENIQFDHDYCSSDSLNNVEFVPEKLVEDIKASTKMMECEEDRSSRKDSGLESGDASEDSEGATVPSGVSSGSKVNYNSILKPRSSNQTGRNKEMLMVSVLKKVRCDTSKTPPKPQTVTPQTPAQLASGRPNIKCVKSNLSVTGNVKPVSSTPKPIESSSRPVSCLNLKESVVKQTISCSKPVEVCVKPTETASPKSARSSTESTTTDAKPAGNLVKPASVTVKPEPVGPAELSIKPSETSDDRSESTVCVKPPEQPKKRKLNLEEYRNRQKALEQKRDGKKISDTPKDVLQKSLASEVVLLSPAPDPCSPPIVVKVESQANEDIVPKNIVPILKPPISVKEDKISEPTSEVIVCKISPKVVEEEEKPEPLPENDVSSMTSTVVKEEKTAEKVLCEESASCVPPIVVKDRKNSESVATIEIEEDAEEEVKPAEEKKKQRQYRARRMSTSSSDGSPQGKKVSVLSIKRENIHRKVNVFPSKPKSRSASVSSSRSRSASSNGSRSSRSSSSDSSSRSGSVKSNRRRATRRRRKKRSSCSRSRSRSSSSSSRSSSSSSRRSNSMSSGSSHRSSRRSSRSRRCSRSRSTKRSRSRRDRSLSRSSWRHWRRDSSRSRSRRERSRSRNRRRESWSSCDRSWSRSRSRSRSSCHRRNTSRSRSQTRSRAGRRLCSYSSRSESRSGSRSRSRSWSSQSRSYSSGCERRLSRSRSRSRKRARVETQRNAKRKPLRSRSPMRRNVDWTHVQKEHNRQVEERRVIYVGRIPEETTKAELRKRFEMFGPIVDISLHFREHADNYGFVTFAYQIDAYNAVERGNDDPNQPRYELCFGGRRKFCRERYADLDGMACKTSMGANLPPHITRSGQGNSFDDMLREVQAKLQARKKL